MPALLRGIGRRARALARWPATVLLRSSRLWSLHPLHEQFGLGRPGQTVGRYYIDRFLTAHEDLVRGRVLEIAENTYTLKYGRDRVTQSDVLFPSAGHPSATLIADLTKSEGLPEQAFDCVILTQTLPVVYDFRAVLRNLHRILRPHGSVLATMHGIVQISRYDADRWGDYWRFTSQSARRIFEEQFPPGLVEVRAYGNVLTAVATLHGLTTSEIRTPELDFQDPDFEVLLGVRATRAG